VYGYGRIYQSKDSSKMAIQLTSNEAVKQAVIAGAWYFDNANNGLKMNWITNN
jgi:hypothetical protein